MFHLAQVTTAYNETSSSGFGVFMIAYIIIFLLLAVPGIYCTWVLYKKAGKPGWAAIIPFYNTYIFGVISKKPMWMVWTAVLMPLVTWIPLLGLILILFALVILLILLSGFVEQYKTSVLFWLGYIFFPLAAMFFVNKVEYIGEGAVAPVGMSSAQSPLSAPSVTPPTFAPAQQPTQMAQPTAETVAPSQPTYTPPAPAQPTEPSQPTDPQNPENTPPQSNTPVTF